MKLLAGWKEKILTVLRLIGLVDKAFTGRIVINMNEGGVTDVHKEERIKQ